ncbi:MAG TPA: LuxR C-terminal-related transcriptional regulator [Solirubrobacteraceae bacterium]|nr:LuxR C-terminal-related transcriptional regulator [Solirubrobacteraceae bacterium]
MSVWDHLTEARDPAVARIVETVREQSFTGLVGEADVGKSALLHAAVARLSDEFTIVMLDFDGAWSPNRLAWRWARELTRAVIGTVALSHLDALSPEMWPASTRGALLQLPAQLGREVAALAEAPVPPRGVGKPDVLDGPVQATRRLAEQKPVLLVLDHLEAPRAAGLGSPDVADLLWRVRSGGQYTPNLHVLVCTRPPAQDLAAGPDSAYHFHGRWLTLDPPSPEAFSHATLAKIAVCRLAHARTGGHPRATVELLEELQREGGQPRDIDSVIGAVAEHHSDLARRNLQHARSVHRFGAHLLLAIVQGHGPYEATPEIAASEIAPAMTRLHLNGLVRRTGPREWASADPRVAWALGGGRGSKLALLPHHEVPTADAQPDTEGEIAGMRRVSGELTTRQRLILEQLANGRSNAEIAESLGLSVSTVKGHLRNVYRQLGVENRHEAAAAVLDGERRPPYLEDRPTGSAT